MVSRENRAAHSSSVSTARTVFSSIRRGIFDSRTSMLSASIAYFGTLSFFPLVATLVATIGIVLSSDQLTDLVENLATILPKDLSNFMSVLLQNVSSHHQTNVAVALIAFGLAIISISGAVDGIIRSINIVYGIKEQRTFIRQRLLSVALTILFIIGMIILLPLVFVGATFLRSFSTPEWIIVAFSILRWVIMVAVLFTGVGIIYHYAPAKMLSPWRWRNWGSLTATAIGLLSSALFFAYLQYFANFTSTYSLFAGIIAFMIWINLGAFSLIVGAHVNASMLKRGTPHAT